MNPSSKLKKSTKTQTKPITARKQVSRKGNEQLTSRGIKQSSKKNQSQESAHKTHRSPQMIKMMINQLQRQLAEKTKFSKTLNEGQFRTTSRKNISSKTMQLGSKTATSTQVGWRSPPRKRTKDTILQANEKTSSKTQKSITQKPSLKKKKIVYSSMEPHQTSAKKIEAKTESKLKDKKIRRQKGSDFIFLGDDLIKLDNIQIPLFIVESNKTDLQRSKRFSSRNQKFIEVDERSSYLRHSKISSFNSVKSQSSVQQANFIQRSFVQTDSKNDSQQDLAFLNNTNNFYSKNQSKEESVSIISTKPLQKKSDPVFDINQIISLNNSVLKIQKWWKKVIQKRKVKNSTEKGLQKQVEVEIPIINQTFDIEEHSQKTIIQQKNLSTPSIELQIKTPNQSQKEIFPVNKQTDHDELLKLRQSAAKMQFQSHQKILKELLSKNKLTSNQFQVKVKIIKQNYENQLKDINNIKNLLSQNTQNIDNFQINIQKDTLIKEERMDENELNQQTMNQKDINKNNQKEESLGSKDSDGVIHFQKKCKRLKVSVFQKDIEEFINQSSQEESSFLSNQNRKVFNSPKSDSQDDLCSPKSNKSNEENVDLIPQCQQNIEEVLFAKEISQAPSGCADQQTGMFPTIQSANFQELYKQYQEQQEVKKQIQSRISRQLGVTDPQDLFSKSDSQIGITTSIVGIHKFLLNFFKFYLYYHKNEFINRMNMPYGEAVQTRLAKNKSKDAHIQLENWTQTTLYTDDDEEIIYGLRYVIPDSVLDDFFESYYEETDIQFTQIEKANIQLEKIHNKAVFEAFNGALNFFRPYFNIGGAPYLWCSSEKSLTFYCIGEENIQEVYEKTQMKVLKNSSYLCGVHIDVPHRNKVQFKKNEEIIEKQCQEINSPFKIMQIQQNSSSKSLKTIKDFDQFLLTYSQNFNPTYLANLEDRLKKKELAEAQQENTQWFCNTFEEAKVSILLNITDFIFEEVFKEQCQAIGKIQAKRSEELLQIA